ncbi:MAG: ROK family protein [Clostridiaceae bacterium]|nr:ROK family protein [Clostridiaceae bacterium]
MASGKSYLGFDIGGTKCAAILGRCAEGSGRPDIIGRRVFPTRETGGPDQVLQRLIEAGKELRGSLPPDEQPVCAGIACGSPLDSRRGVIQSPPNLPGWDNIPVTQMVESSLGIPAWLLNDADAGALAEWRFGAGQGCKNMIFITFGTGFGAGLILNGRLYSGIDDGAGEIGHIRVSPTGPVGYGKAGSLEGFCSGGGIAQLARTLVMEKTQMGERVAFCEAAGGIDKLTAKVVGEAADTGDPLARHILAVSGEYLGRGLALLLDLLNPERIIIGSIFVRSYSWIWPAAEAVMREESLERTFRRCQVARAALGESIGDLAALSVAMEGERGGFAI